MEENIKNVDNLIEKIKKATQDKNDKIKKLENDFMNKQRDLFNNLNKEIDLVYSKFPVNKGDFLKDRKNGNVYKVISIGHNNVNPYRPEFLHGYVFVNLGRTIGNIKMSSELRISVYLSEMDKFFENFKIINGESK